MNATKRIALGALVLLGLLITGLPLVGQDAVPTLVPPTLVPTVPPPFVDGLPSESGAALMSSAGVARFGVLYNEPPFAELNVRGELSGFDADLARALAEVWGVTAEFVQVTRQTGVEMLEAGEIDLLLAAQPHLRALDSRIEFSESYYPSAQVMLVREGDAAQSLAEMTGRRIGYVMGSRGETAVQEWTRRTGIQVSAQPYVNFDQALSALNGSEIDGLVENRVRILRFVTQPGIARILTEPVMNEPFAIGLRRQDVNLRALVNRTLHFFLISGRLNEIHRANFNNIDYPSNTMIPYINVGDSAPTLSSVPGDVPYPPNYVVPRLQSDRVLRVAGINDVPPDAPESVRRLDTVHRSLINEFARRWNVSVVYVPGTTPYFELLPAGGADLYVGVVPDWNGAALVDFTEPYLVHGRQLMIETNGGVNSFGDLRGKAVGYFIDEPGAVDAFNEQALSARALIDDLFQLANENDAAFAMLAATDINLSAVWGDSLRLYPHLQANPDTLTLLKDPDGNPLYYSREYYAMAMPRNDLDFTLLVEYTMQEMILDGTMASIMSAVIDPSGIPRVEIWPGSSTYLGFSLSGTPSG
ncbi:MAG: transporter substrate-binding domain-containing protein [Pleurocapsa minor GSE-CHR-MK-17-07R]|jgi:polar amino acid transport system substrate-binding protein|nr:transporter substrate-binding domain-containing protein [Pleurocapsa minor GSE-CHR-MK 17-07R]